MVITEKDKKNQEFILLENKVSFGQVPYDRVVNELKGNDISFCIVDKEREYFKFDGDNEIYNNYLTIANKAYDKQKRKIILLIE